MRSAPATGQELGYTDEAELARWLAEASVTYDDRLFDLA